MDVSVAASNDFMLTQTDDDAANEEEEDDAEDDNDPPAPDITGGGGEDAPLDFSLKKSADEGSASETDDLSSTPNGLSPPSSNQDGPLDLSVPRRRRDKSDISRHSSKVAKLEAALALPTSPWGYNTPKHLSKSVTAAKNNSTIGAWNGRVKQERREKSPGSSTKLNRLPAAYHQPLLHKNIPLESKLPIVEGRKNDSKTDPYRPAGRQNPWQSQWMSRSSEQTKDVFTCVWCKESFRSLADMTIHMKQSPRCGMAGMQTTVPATSPTTSITGPSATPLQTPLSSKCSTASSASSSAAAIGAASNTIKENVSLPRKLVRGQDVWLGKGAEQTRQILKCMWCGQSFKSLADMTTHMRVTQHYTNIISQEQIISWRTPEDKMAAQSQVNAVLTCKVCDQAFGSLKELSYHMVKNSHYKEHILRSITEGGGRRRQTRERRKKSLPVRKLLELERMELNKDPGSKSAGGGDISHQQTKNEVVDGKISCEECTEKVDAKDFVQHIKNCAQGSRSHSVKSSPGLEGSKSSVKDSSFDGPMSSGITAPSSSSPLNTSQEPSQNDTKNATSSSSQQVLQQHQQEDSMCDSVESGGSTSVLNAIEKLIEKSFETKGRRNTVSTGILQRLGIDEEVYPPWHPSSSPSTFGAPFRSSLDLQRKSTSPLSRVHDFKVDVGDFSGSESRSRSSSTSEKHPTSFDDHLRLTFGLTTKDIMNRVSTPSSASQSCSPVHFRTSESPVDDRNNVFVAKNTGRSSTPTPTPSSHNAISTAASPSPKRRKRSTTPSSDRDPCEVNSVEDELTSRNVEQDPDESLAANIVPKLEPPEPKPVDTAIADRATPKSEGRKTPGSRGSSVEPDSSVVTTPLNPTALAKSIPKKRKNSSKQEDHHHHSHKSSSSHKRRTMRSPKRKNSDLPSDHESAVGSPLSTGSADFASPKHSDTNNASAAGDHPLKELQKLLDKTDAHLSRPSLPATPGSILAFSWACSEATASDSLMKCAFCDTHFISKGAYRHHLSKMHFVKDGSVAEIAAAATWKPQQPHPTSGIKSGSSASSNGTGIPVSCSSGQAAGHSSSGGNDNRSSPAAKEQLSTDESPHSKFQKYTELAKQLSSKYV